MQEIINLLNVVYVDVQCVSGTVSKSERAKDEVFTDGTVRYIDPKLLRPYSRARQACARLCRSVGTRFLNAWAVPDESMDELRAGLAEISADLTLEKASLIPSLAGKMLDWELAHPEVLPYKGRFPSAAAIDAGIDMKVSMYKISPSQVGNTSIKDGIQTEISGLAGQVLSEIAQDVRDSWTMDATAASTRSRRILERMAKKLDSLAFVNSDLAEVATMIRDVLDVLPAEGPIKGHDFIILSGLMNTLSDPEKVVTTARIAAAQSPKELWLPEQAGWLGFNEAAQAPVEALPDPHPAAGTPSMSVTPMEKRPLFDTELRVDEIPVPALKPSVAQSTSSAWCW